MKEHHNTVGKVGLRSPATIIIINNVQAALSLIQPLQFTLSLF